MNTSSTDAGSTPSATSSTETTEPAIVRFAAAVRARLSDLPADDVDDLTDGLEADLAEKIQDQKAATSATGDSIAFASLLGDPTEYADELRSSAGIPANTTAPPRMNVRAELRSRVDMFAARIRSNSFAAKSLDFLISLRPVWWMLRAYVAFDLAHYLYDGRHSQRINVPVNFIDWVILMAAVFISVQWGRGYWAKPAWVRFARRAASVVVIIALPSVVAGYDSIASSSRGAAYAYAIAQGEPSSEPVYGLSLNGVQLSNIFAYGADGNPLTNIRLFAPGGKPLNLTDPQEASLYSNNEADLTMVPSQASAGGTGWNTYPLDTVPRSDVNGDGSFAGKNRVAARPPFARIQPLIAADPAAPSAEATPGSSPAPSDAAAEPSSTPVAG